MKRPAYFSYLLRLWRSGADGEALWHASLESPLTGERRGFAALHDLFAFLADLTTEPAAESGIDRATMPPNPIDQE
jgi:hypothetical protein